MRIVETYEGLGSKYTVWECPECGSRYTTLEGGEPAGCSNCIAEEAEFDAMENEL